MWRGVEHKLGSQGLPVTTKEEQSRCHGENGSPACGRAQPAPMQGVGEKREVILLPPVRVRCSGTGEEWTWSVMNAEPEAGVEDALVNVSDPLQSSATPPPMASLPPGWARCGTAGEEPTRAEMNGQVEATVDHVLADAADPLHPPAAHPANERLVGTTIGNYCVRRLLGSGGMADVYLVEHRHLGRRFALKRLKNRVQSEQSLVSLFFEEARSISQIYHPNIVEITDFIRTPAHQCYVMENLEGQTVDQLLEDMRRIPGERAVQIVAQVCAALETLHDAGIVHRDIKPANIMLIERQGMSDFVKLLDFGVARFLKSGTDVSNEEIEAGVCLGTPGYMAPEQVFGCEVDSRADIYSMGVLLYQMVTGQKPFTGETWGKLVVRQTTERPRPPSQVTSAWIGAALDALILDCLALKPQDRPQSVREVGERLIAISSGRTKADSAARREAVTGRRRLALYVAGGLVVAAGLLAGAYLKTLLDSHRVAESAGPDRAVSGAEMEILAADTGDDAGAATDQSPTAARELDVSVLRKPARAKKRRRPARMRRRSRAKTTGSDRLFDQFE